MPKVTQELQTLYDEYSAYLTSHRPGTFEPSGPFARVVGDQVVIDAVASVEVDDLKADLEALGMRQAVAVGRVVSGRIPIASIPAMAALPTLKFAGPAPALIPRDPR